MNKFWIIVLRDFVQDLVDSIISIVRMLLHSKFNLSAQLDKHSHENCVILGNGPSLTNTLKSHSSFLEGKLLICVNHFPKSEEYETLMPQVFVTGAPDLWLDEIEQAFVQSSNELFRTMSNKTTWPLQLYIPYEARRYQRWQSHLANNANISIVYYNNTPIEGWTWFKYHFFRKNVGMPRPHNVMIPSLFLAINAGLKNIYLFGADHSWLPEISVDDQNKVLINQKHFYDEGTTKAKALDKRGHGERKLWELLHKFMLAFKGYFILKKYAEKRGVAVLNATPKSFIDAFERIEISNSTK